MKIRPGPELPPATFPPRRPITATPVITVQTPPAIENQEQAHFRVADTHELAWLAALVYLPTHTFDVALAAEGFTHIKPLSRWLTGTRGVLALKGKRVVIAFRGSESTLDWFLDCLLVPWGRPPRHLGFQCAWWSVRAKVNAYLEEHRSLFDRVELCGHSLGGAVAKVAAFDLAPAWPVDAVVTLGAPRVFWGSGVRKYDEALTADGRQLGDLTLSYVNGYDVVAMMPPAFLGYQHTKGLQESRTENDGFWIAELFARIKLRQKQTPPMLLALPVLKNRPSKEPPGLRSTLLDLLAGAYCGLEKYGGVFKLVVLNLLAPLGLFVAYLWILWLVAGASLSHRLILYRQEFFGPSLAARRLALPSRSIAAKLGGLVLVAPLLALGLLGAYKLLTFSWIFLGWVWRTTLDILRQLN